MTWILTTSSLSCPNVVSKVPLALNCKVNRFSRKLLSPRVSSESSHGRFGWRNRDALSAYGVSTS